MLAMYCQSPYNTMRDLARVFVEVSSLRIQPDQLIPELSGLITLSTLRQKLSSYKHSGTSQLITKLIECMFHSTVHDPEVFDLCSNSILDVQSISILISPNT